MTNEMGYYAQHKHLIDEVNRLTDLNNRLAAEAVTNAVKLEALEKQKRPVKVLTPSPENPVVIDAGETFFVAVPWRAGKKMRKAKIPDIYIYEDDHGVFPSLSATPPVRGRGYRFVGMYAARETDVEEIPE